MLSVNFVHNVKAIARSKMKKLNQSNFEFNIQVCMYSKIMHFGLQLRATRATRATYLKMKNNFSVKSKRGGKVRIIDFQISATEF